MRIFPTEIQELEFDLEGFWLEYDKGWFWTNGLERTSASDEQAADALLERVLVLESELMDLKHTKDLSDTILQALQANELLDMLSKKTFIE